MKRLLLAALLWPSVLGAAPKPLPPPRVLSASFSGVISPVSAEYLQAAVHKAAEGNYDALVIELDTPGGLDLSMREIVKALLSSTVPVIVYVSPAGARAASAGVFITMAAHVAAMTPGTNIGAAHPVQLGGPAASEKEKPAKDEVMESKMTNDSRAYLQAIASRRGRSVEWAGLFVAQSTSIASALAVSENVVDFEADSLSVLLARIDGRKLADFKDAPLRTKDAVIERFEMSRRQKLLAAVSDPNIAMVLMSLGVSGMLIELYSPGLILPGIVGAVSLILAFYSFQTLSANFAGVLLMFLGVVLFILELKIVSFGLLALSGTAAILFGAMMLFKETGGGLAVSWSVIAGTVGSLVVLLSVLLYIAKSALSRKATIGPESVSGQRGTAVSALSPEGQVMWRGELWRARSLEGTVPAGVEVVIESVDGLTLKVRKT